MSTNKSSLPKRKTTINSDELMESHEAMRVMKISRATFYRLINEGKIPGAIKVGSGWRIIRKEFWEKLAAKSS